MLCVDLMLLYIVLSRFSVKVYAVRFVCVHNVFLKRSVIMLFQIVKPVG